MGGMACAGMMEMVARGPGLGARGGCLTQACAVSWTLLAMKCQAGGAVSLSRGGRSGGSQGDFGESGEVSPGRGFASSAADDGGALGSMGVQVEKPRPVNE